jgi:hypothetical protein
MAAVSTVCELNVNHMFAVFQVSPLVLTCLRCHVTVQVRSTPKCSLLLSNFLWAAATLQRSQSSDGVQQQRTLLRTADLDVVAQLLTDPARVRHLTAAGISISVSSLAKLGYQLSPEQLTQLLQQFLQPSALRHCHQERSALPKNFQNVCWGIIRMRQESVLRQQGFLQQLVSAWFAAGAKGGVWAGSDADPTAAANMLWAVALVCKGQDTHEKRWIELQAKDSSSKASIPTAATVDDDSNSSRGEDDAVADAPAPPAAEAYVSQQDLRRLFGSFMQHRTLAAANSVDISVVLWAAAVLNQPLPADDIQWLLSAFLQQDRLAAASAESISNVMYAVTHQQVRSQQLGQQQALGQLQRRQELLQQQWRQPPSESPEDLPSQPEVSLRPTWSSSKTSASRMVASPIQSPRNKSRATLSFSTPALNSNSSGGLPGQLTEGNSPAPVLLKLVEQLLLHIPHSISTADLTVALLSLAKAFVLLGSSNASGSGSGGAGRASSSSRGAWAVHHKRMLQEALWRLLQQMLQLMPATQSEGSGAYCPASMPSSEGGSSGSFVSRVGKAAAQGTRTAGWDTHQQQQQHHRTYSKVSKHVSLQTLVDAVWACDIIGAAHVPFLAAVCKAAVQPGVGSVGGAAPPAVQQLQWGNTVCLLERLASLNQLTPEVWAFAMQPLLQKAAGTGVADVLLGQTASRMGSQLGAAQTAQAPSGSSGLLQDQWDHAAGWVPRLCWAAAAGNCLVCRKAVVMLCQRWVAHIAQQHQGKPRQPYWGISSSRERQVGVADRPGCWVKCLGVYPSSSSAAVFEAVDSNSLRQLWQVHMWLQDSHCTSTSSSGGSGTDCSVEGTGGGNKDSSSSSSSSSSRGDVYDSSSGLLAAFSAEQLAVCEAAWKSQVQQVTTSRWQEDLADAVAALPGVANVQLEQLTGDGCFSIDIGAELVDIGALATTAGNAHTLAAAASGSAGPRVSTNGLQPPMQQLRAGKQQPGAVNIHAQEVVDVCWLAVEADGPSHFVLTGFDLDICVLVLRGEAQMRSRALQARGYVVVRVSYLDWELRQQQGQEMGSDGCSQGSLRWLAGQVVEAVHAGG